MNLYFENRFSELKFVKSDVTLETAGAAIKEYVKSINPNFKIYYIRTISHSDKGYYTFDVGSHSEFFILKP